MLHITKISIYLYDNVNRENKLTSFLIMAYLLYEIDEQPFLNKSLLLELYRQKYQNKIPYNWLIWHKMTVYLFFIPQLRNFLK
jgi:hypothetical protein